MRDAKQDLLCGSQILIPCQGTLAVHHVSHEAGITSLLQKPPIIASVWSTGSLRADQNMRNLITMVWVPCQSAVGPQLRQLECGENTESSSPSQQTKATAKTLAFLVPTLAEPSRPPASVYPAG